MQTLNQDFWDNRWDNKETGWDLGQASPAIAQYMSQLENKDLDILIPGCGNAYEAVYLLEQGFTNITLIDIAPTLVAQLQSQFEGQNIQIICGDFFEHQSKYDLILEQTFFCAIPRNLRADYAQKMHELLNTNGRIVGLLFASEFTKEGPPFGGTASEYKTYFEPYFHIQKMETCYNSIAPRAGNELFINFQKK